METKFLPGPWVINHPFGEYADDAAGPVICEVDRMFGPSITIRSQQATEMGTVDDHERLSTANAHLIASSPDLYEALEALVRAVNTNELAAAMACHSIVSFANVEDALKPALAALARARGETA